MAREIFQDKGNGTQPNKKHDQSDASHKLDLSDKPKGSNHTAKPLWEYTKNKTNNKNKPTCPLHGPGQDMNSCKFMQEKVKYTKETWLYACGGGGHSKFTGAKRLVPSQDVHFFYTRSHLSELQKYALIFSINCQFNFILKENTTQFSHWIV